MPFKKVDCVKEMEDKCRQDKEIYKYAKEFNEKYENAKLTKQKINY